MILLIFKIFTRITNHTFKYIFLKNYNICNGLKSWKVFSLGNLVVSYNNYKYIVNNCEYSKWYRMFMPHFDLQVNDVNFENMSNDDAVRILREIVSKNG